MKKLHLLLIILCLLFQTIKVHTKERKSSVFTEGIISCECSDIFDDLVNKIEQNYIAYHIEIKGKREKEYLAYKNTFKLKAKNSSKAGCIEVLKEFIEFYKDGHLYIGQFPKPNEEQIKELIANAEVINFSENEVKKYLIDREKKLDPIEGIWFANDSTKYAIIRNKTKQRDFVAFLLSNSSEKWKAGHVKAEFKKLKDGSYDVVYYDKNHYPLHPGAYTKGQKGGAAIRRDLILHMPPISWGKEFPVKTENHNYIDKTDPRKPTIKIIDSDNILIAIPSHRPEFAEILKLFIEEHEDKIRNAKNLILDLRGNEGGSSGVTNVLLPYIETKENNPHKYWVDDKMYVLSSSRNIEYYKNAQKQGWAPEKLVKRAEENAGNIIPFQDPVDNQIVDETATKDEAIKTKELSMPKNVAILMDGSIVSAGETFILNAMKNNKVTLFGQPTAGCIDYQSTYWINLTACSELGLFLGYPMFAASNRLPEGGVNRTGIEPDVFIDKNEKNNIGFIIEYYNKN
ncbi:S41 family peptidase [Xanthomarina gelatinilytica]|uniref:S41 family peptidase n=1 Tax=Xanthomarina gelatinilytica TaxID=1137281 RepID=UPI003AA94009